MRAALRRIGAVLVVAFAVLAGSLGLAGAAPARIAGASVVAGTSSTAPPSSFICASGSNQASTAADGYLPINRWASATSTQHSRLSLNLFNIGNLPNVVQRDFVVADAQALGNTFWKAGVGLTEAATRFCFADSVASTADGLTATIGRALSNGGLVALLLVAAAILILVRLRRGDGTARHQIVKVLVVLLVFAVMVNGAESTKTNANGSVSFGFGSPGWVLTHVYDAVSTVASAPAAALSGAADSLSFGGKVAQRIDAADPLACGNYVNSLRADYRAAYGASATASMAATVPLALDSMWEQSGLSTYAYAQFGANNDYAPLVYCRLLEANVNVSPATQVAITDQTPGAAAILSGTKDAGGPSTALAWASDQSLGASPNDTTDESMVGWAACQTSSSSFAPMEWSSSTGASVPSEWASVVDPHANGSVYGTSGTVTPKLCGAFFDLSWKHLQPQGTAFEWADNPGQIAAAANGPGGPYPGFADYVDTLHGTSNGPAEMLSIMFLISSTIDLLVFGVMAGAVLVAKFSLLFLMAFAALFLLLSLWPGAAASSRLAGLAKHAFSMVLFVTGAQVILSIVAITTSIIMDTGTAVAGQGTFLSLLWMGIAPIAAIFIVHHLFKQVLKAPSPFKLSSAMAWGAASGGIGAGVTAGIDRIASRKAVWGTTKRAAGAIGAPFAASRRNRNLMAPAGSGTQAGLGPSGAAAGALAQGNGAASPAPGSPTAVGTGVGQAAPGATADTKTVGTKGLSGGKVALGAGAGKLAPANGSAPALPTSAGAPETADRVTALGPTTRQGTDAMVQADSLEQAGVAQGELAQGELAQGGVAQGGVAQGGVAQGDVLEAAVDAAGVGAGVITAQSLAKQARRRHRQKRSAVAGQGTEGRAGGKTGKPSPGGTTASQAYADALGYVASRRSRLGLDGDGILRTRTGRIVGGPMPNERGRVTDADTRSVAEKLHDDRVLRRATVRAGRKLNREALQARASGNLLNRFAEQGHRSKAGRALAKTASALGKAESIQGRTLQRVAERTRRAAAEFRAKPVHRQLASVAKVGAMGVAAMALMAAPPALGVAAGAYALRRAHKARLGVDAVHANNQRHIATFTAAAGAERARRQETARAAALERADAARQEKAQKDAQKDAQQVATTPGETG
ncbi:MAG: hypothetical protein M0Z42_18845, partial [Actinomycetota bacterium]|nr:hypothetical protein [Actinomycetota bacterium]